MYKVGQEIRVINKQTDRFGCTLVNPYISETFIVHRELLNFADESFVGLRLKDRPERLNHGSIYFVPIKDVEGIYSIIEEC